MYLRWGVDHCFSPHPKHSSPHIKQAIMQSQQVGRGDFLLIVMKLTLAIDHPLLPIYQWYGWRIFNVWFRSWKGMLVESAILLMIANSSFIFRLRTTSPLIMNSW